MAAARWCLLPLSVALLLGCGARGPAVDPHEVAVEVGSVAVDRASGSPVVILEEMAGDRRALPIWIGVAEAHSIAAEMEHRRGPRPNTHDLAKALVDQLDGAVLRVVVTELRDGTYYALLFLASHGEVFEIDARPSDAIALALRFGAPVYVREPLFEQALHATPPQADEHST
jgi:bifunctional DNase/RNase